jgi:hypothetical protein
MSRLKDRNKFIPNGFVFYQPETGWQPQRMQSFETIVAAIIAHRNANPWLKEKNGWPIDPDTVREELDRYNAKVCEHMGWRDYISSAGDAGPPLTPPLPQRLLHRGANVVAGADTLVDWIASGAEAVVPEQSANRAAVCATCPKNGQGDLLSYFTKPAAEAIRRTVERKNEMSLTTPDDDKLGICEVCDCPLKLKVHLPIETIVKKLSPVTRSELPDFCWIRKETP